MAKFKVNISDPEAGESRFVEIEEARAAPLLGRRLGEVIDGSLVGAPGCKLKVTGGSDKDGFPMRPDVHGGVRVQVIVTGGVGFRPSRGGERRRKTLRGSVITEDIVQVNTQIVKPEPEPKPEEAKPEEPGRVWKQDIGKKEKKPKPEEAKPEEPEKGEKKTSRAKKVSEEPEGKKPRKSAKPKG